MPACYGWGDAHRDYCKLSVILFALALVYTVNLRLENLDVMHDLETLNGFVHQSFSDILNIIGALVKETPIDYLLIIWLAIKIVIPIVSLSGNTCKSEPAVIVAGVFRWIMVATEIATIISVVFSPEVRHFILQPLVNRLGSEYQTSLNVTENPLVRSYAPGNEFSRAVDYIQAKFQCCGINGIEDYGSSSLSPTCCEIKNHKKTASMIFAFELENDDDPLDMEFADIQCINNISLPATTGQRSKGCITDFKLTPETKFGGSALFLIIILAAFLMCEFLVGGYEICCDATRNKVSPGLDIVEHENSEHIQQHP